MSPNWLSAVETGMWMSLLRSRPTSAEPRPPARPTGSSTPITRNTVLSTLMVAPIGSRSRKNCLAISLPITQTGARDAMSSSLM